jgi:hypothetical protein
MEMSSLQIDPWSAGASRAREQLLEHQLLGEIIRRMLLAGRRCEVLRAESDASGHDVVLESDGVLRHIQLKAMRADGRRADVNIHTALADKPSGCAIWMLVDPSTLMASAFLWFGGAPGEPLPDLGHRSVRHTKGDATGAKAVRPDLRLVRRSQFERVATYDALADRLFGTALQRDIGRLRRHLRKQPLVPCDAPAWLAHAQAGRFDSLPDRLDDEALIQFAHLVDGYVLSSHPSPSPAPAAWIDQVMDDPGAMPSDLWAAIFLEHRRFRLEGREASREEAARLEASYGRLQSSLSRA